MQTAFQCRWLRSSRTDDELLLKIEAVMRLTLGRLRNLERTRFSSVDVTCLNPQIAFAGSEMNNDTSQVTCFKLHQTMNPTRSSDLPNLHRIIEPMWIQKSRFSGSMSHFGDLEAT